MTDHRRTPRTAWLVGLLLSFAVAGLVVVAFLVTAPSTMTRFLTPVLLVSLGALVFSLVWPAGSWRWGVVLSSGFCTFFLAVFIAYLTIGQWDPMSLLRALSSLVAGLVGSALGTKLRDIGGSRRPD